MIEPAFGAAPAAVPRAASGAAPGAVPDSAAVPEPDAADRPWTVHYEPGVPAGLAPSDALFPDIVASAAASGPTYPALSFFGRETSYAALWAQVERVAGALVREGVARGAPVLVALPPCPPAAAALLGAMRAGALARTCPPTPEAAEAALRDSGAMLGFVTPAMAAALADARPEARLVLVDPRRALPLQLRWIARLVGPRSPGRAPGRAWTRWLGGASAAEELPAPSPDDPALHAGETRFRHRQLVAAAAQLRAWLTDAAPTGETWLLLSPLGSPLGLTAALGAAAALRARVVLLPGDDGQDVVDALRFLRPTWVLADRGATARLARDPRLARADLRSLRAWICPGPIEADDRRAFEEAAGLPLCLGYSPPGVAGFAACSPINGHRVPGSVGLPMPGVHAAPAGRGLLALDGPNVAPGPEGGARVLRGRLDDEGYLFADSGSEGATPPQPTLVTGSSPS